MRISEKSYHAFFESAPEAIVLFGLHSRNIIDVNKRALEYFDAEHDDLVGANITDLFRDHASLQEHLQALDRMEKDGAVVVTHKLESGPGVDLMISSTVIPLGDDIAVQTVIRRASETGETAVRKRRRQIQRAAATQRQPRVRTTAIDTTHVRRLTVFYSGFVMAAALRDLLAQDGLETDYRSYPDDFDAETGDFMKTDFLIFAVPRMTDLEVTDLKDLCRNNRNLLILAVSLNATNRHIITLIKAGVRGIITNENEFHLMPAAVNAIVNNELWCPRSILQQVFENYRISFSGRHDRASENVLSERELEILKLIVKGYKNKEIAAKLGISYSTVINHTYNIYRKLDVNNRAGAIRYAINNRLVGII